MNILTFSSLYPNNVDTGHGIFVERRLQELVNRTDIQPTVVSPVPWFPSKSKVFGRYAKSAAISPTDRRSGIEIIHPRFPLLPKIGMNSAAVLMARACRRVVRERVAERAITLIDAHYFYPDGVAAAKLARENNLPYCITARGSDINLITKFDSPRRQMQEAAADASAIIAVSEALAESMRSLGMPPKKIHVLRNGVDLNFFSPGNKEKTGNSSGKESPTFLSVGALKKAKGHDLAIQFVQRVPTAQLVIVGSGHDETYFRSMVERLGIANRIEFTGAIDSEKLRSYYRSADATILMSEREGMPNVILESLACGTPVLATPVGGIPEIMSAPVCGELVAQRSAVALDEAWKRLSQRGTDTNRIREYARRFSWNETIDRLYSLMSGIASQNLRSAR